MDLVVTRRNRRRMCHRGQIRGELVSAYTWVVLSVLVGRDRTQHHDTRAFDPGDGAAGTVAFPVKERVPFLRDHLTRLSSTRARTAASSLFAANSRSAGRWSR